jgi:hypothetical protein
VDPRSPPFFFNECRFCILFVSHLSGYGGFRVGGGVVRGKGRRQKANQEIASSGAKRPPCNDRNSILRCRESGNSKDKRTYISRRFRYWLAGSPVAPRRQKRPNMDHPRSKLRCLTEFIICRMLKGLVVSRSQYRSQAVVISYVFHKEGPIIGFGRLEIRGNLKQTGFFEGFRCTSCDAGPWGSRSRSVAKAHSIRSFPRDIKKGAADPMGPPPVVRGIPPWSLWIDHRAGVVIDHRDHVVVVEPIQDGFPVFVIVGGCSAPRVN